MPPTPSCPDLKQYKQLACGQLSSPDKEAVLSHLESCDACAQRVESLADKDTLVELIRQANTLDDGSGNDTIARLVKRLRALRPSAPEAGPTPGADQVFACTACAKTMKVKAGLAGKKVKCPHCQAVNLVPVPPSSGVMPPSPSVADAQTLAPGTGNAGGGKSQVVTAADHGNGASQASPVRKELCDFLAPAQAPDELGRLGPYRVLRILGAGGMGVVFQAEDPHLQRLVALKAMLPGLAASESAKQRFLREARAAAKLKHDHIVTIHQVGEDRGAPFLAMEFLEGEPLDDRLKREGKLPLEEILRIGREMAEGLAAAHERGLIHRDIKPANVWLEGKKSRVKILDFGLARAATGEAHLTQSGAIVGTPSYMAPEQAQGKNVDPRCDLFSLGCVLYRMTTGEQPFKGSDMISTLMAVATDDPAPPVSLNFELPTELSDLIMELLAKKPEERPASAQAVVEALEQIAADQRSPSAAREQKKGKVPAAVSSGRGRRIAIAAVAAALLVGLGVWFSGILVRVETKDGTLIIKTDDPTVAVNITPEGGTVLYYGKDRREIKLKPGKYGIELAQAKEGLKLTTTQFTIASGDNRTIEVVWEKKDGAAATTTKPGKAVEPAPALEALRRDQIAPEALAAAGDGDPKKAPARLVAALGEATPMHTQPVCLAFSPDGLWLGSGSADSTLFLRDPDTGKVRRVLTGHTGAVSSVAFSKDSKTLLSGSHDGTIRLWQVDKEMPPQVVEPTLGPLTAMAASVDGRFLAAGSAGGTVTLWKWGQWDAPQVITPKGGKVTGLAFSPDGEVLSFSQDEKDQERRINLAKTSNAKPAHSWPAHKGVINALSFSSDGKRLASAGDFFIRVWDLESRTAIFEETNVGERCAIVFHPDGKHVFAGLGGLMVELFELSSKKPVRNNILGQRGNIRAIAYRPDLKRLAIATDFGVVEVRDFDTWQPQVSPDGHAHHITALAAGPNGTVLSTGHDYALRRWDVALPGKGKLIHQFDRSTQHIALSPDGQKVATVSSYVWYDTAHRGLVLDAASGKRLFVVTPEGLVRAFTYSPDGKVIAGSNHHTGCVLLWDAASGKQIHQFPKGGVADAPPAFSADGGLLAAVASKDGKLIHVWNVASGELVHAREVVPPVAIALNPKGDSLALGHVDGSISLWNLADKSAPKRVLGGHSAQIAGLKFTPDGKTLISSSFDGTIRLWNPAQERALREIIPVGPANKPLLFDLDPSGRYLFAAGHSQLIFVLRLTADSPIGQPTTENAPSRYKNSLGMEFALVPKGKAWLGGGGAKPGDREFQVKEDFYLGVYEVTQEEWEKVMDGEQPSFFSRKGASKDVIKDIPDADLKRFPVEGVSWDKAQAFVSKLNAREKQPGWIYRLPTEDEWEYACRGGPLDKLDSGFDFYFDKPSNSMRLDQANFSPGGLGRTCKVGTYKPNSLGLYDMHGNVWEWCIHREKAADGTARWAVRGGSWPHFAGTHRAAGRDWVDGLPRTTGGADHGLRVARVPISSEIPKIAEKQPTTGTKPAPTFTNSLGMEFALVPKGKAWLGGGGSKPGDKECEAKQDFYLGVYPVTQKEWDKLMVVKSGNPSWFSRQGPGKEAVADIADEKLKRFPVENITWYDCRQFLANLNLEAKESGWIYRLPMEAEWEYACRGGPMADKAESAFDFYFDQPTHLLLPGQAHFGMGEKGRTCPVGSFKANRLGLHDLHGNVRVWCDDEVPNPINPGASSHGVSRGGSYLSSPENCRAGARFLHAHSHQHPSCGLRVVRVPVDFQPGTVWKGQRIYKKGAYSPATVTYELHVRERDGTKFKGHVFDNGPGRNHAKIEGEIQGDTLQWRERPGHMSDAVLTMQGTLQGDTILLSFKGNYGKGRPGNEGEGQLQLVSPIVQVR